MHTQNLTFLVSVLGQLPAGPWKKALYVAKPERPVYDIYALSRISVVDASCMQRS